MRSLQFKIFSASFLITFLFQVIATSINMHVPFFIITDYDIRFIVRLLQLLFYCCNYYYRILVQRCGNVSVIIVTGLRAGQLRK